MSDVIANRSPEFIQSLSGEVGQNMPFNQGLIPPIGPGNCTIGPSPPGHTVTRAWGAAVGTSRGGRRFDSPDGEVDCSRRHTVAWPADALKPRERARPPIPRAALER
jgi:hypothetical protein